MLHTGDLPALYLSVEPPGLLSIHILLFFSERCLFVCFQQWLEVGTFPCLTYCGHMAWPVFVHPQLSLIQSLTLHLLLLPSLLCFPHSLVYSPGYQASLPLPILPPLHESMVSELWRLWLHLFFPRAELPFFKSLWKKHRDLLANPIFTWGQGEGSVKFLVMGGHHFKRQ